MTLDIRRTRVTLASRSPQRFQLLGQLVDADCIDVRPPADASEPGFEGLCDMEQIRARLQQIAVGKYTQSVNQCELDPSPETGSRKAGLPGLVLAADTVIVVESDDHRYQVLGQPPPEPDYAATVRQWFEQYLLGRSHRVISAVCVGIGQPTPLTKIVETGVTFRSDVADLVEWYIASGEPIGKAGGYAIQGAGSLFVHRVEGSLSNVIGLPLNETLQMLSQQRHGLR